MATHLASSGSSKKELPLGLQCATLFILWFVWLAAMAFVIWREQRLAYEWRYYDYPFFVYPLVFTYIPFVLSVAGIVLLRRVKIPADAGRSQRMLRLLVVGATFVAIAVTCTLGIWALTIPWEIIRE